MLPVICPHCVARYDRPTWRSLALLDRVDVVDVGWIELRRCASCEREIAAAADDEMGNDELLPTDAAARYCGLSISGLRQAARRGHIRPWTSSGWKLLWKRSELDTFLETKARTRAHACSGRTDA
jgi:hypothetical protein